MNRLEYIKEISDTLDIPYYELLVIEADTHIEEYLNNVELYTFDSKTTTCKFIKRIKNSNSAFSVCFEFHYNVNKVIFISADSLLKKSLSKLGIKEKDIDKILGPPFKQFLEKYIADKDIDFQFTEAI